MTSARIRSWRRLLAGCALAGLASVSSANDVEVRIEGPVPGGDLAFGFHDDFLGVEYCGGTCFAPGVCQVVVPCTSADTPADVADRIAQAIAADPACQAMGFSAVSSIAPDGSGRLSVSGPPGLVYNCCADLWPLRDRRGCCPSTLATPGGGFQCVASEYCSTKINSLGCIPLIGAAGLPSVSSPDPYLIAVQPALNLKPGLLLYGLVGGALLPFNGGVLCVQPPYRRTPAQPAGGSPPPIVDCSGAYGFDFNAWLRDGNEPSVQPGDKVSTQYWMRDPDHPDGSGLSLSNAHDFVVEG